MFRKSHDHKKHPDRTEKSLPKKIFFKAFRILFIAYIGLLLFLYFFQSIFLFQPKEEYLGTPALVSLKYEEVAITSNNGNILSGWFVPKADAGQAVLFCHSNYGNISYFIQDLHAIHQMGFPVLVFDYQGYGKSGGEPSEESLHADGEAAWNYLLSRGYGSDRIILWGRSLGGAVAARLAVDHEPAALVIESTFIKFPEVARDFFPYVPVSIIARYDLDVEKDIKKIDCPLLIVHSRDDEIIDFRHGKKLFQAAHEPKSFLEISGSHNDGYYSSGLLYYQSVNKFLESVIKDK